MKIIPINRFLRTWIRLRKVGLVIVGHGVVSNESAAIATPNHDRFDDLIKTVERYQDWGFRFISIEELIEIAKAKFRSRVNWVHLTFDDGYESIFTQVYPFLKQKQIPFSLYISTHHIQHSERYYTYRIRTAVQNSLKNIRISGTDLFLAANSTAMERAEFTERAIEQFKAMSMRDALETVAYTDSLLSPNEWHQINRQHSEDSLLTGSQVVELSNDSLVHVGSHNHHHIILNNNVSPKDVEQEMKFSRDWLKANLSENVLTYSYPNGNLGDFSEFSRRICKKLGYELAFTAVDEFVSPETDAYLIPRIWLAASETDFSIRLLRLLLPQRIIDIAKYFRLSRSVLFSKDSHEQKRFSKSKKQRAVRSIDA